MCVLFESFKNFETLIRKRRKLGEPFDLVINWGKLTYLKLTTKRKSITKQQILMYKTAVYILVNGVITHQKQSKLQNCAVQNMCFKLSHK